ncbi:hypothetical protein EVAR_22396_1 [Eumeta japonica]|uniref:Uncharacterized protein n=1 Tax=Eumeta variegata TaxID=151549 RepID=A0A4C1VKC7_EUMVA|nr:hypothetical protein EVAR_22396_1 [Eumeta japonica]
MNRRSESVSPNETLVSPLGCRAYPKAQPRLQSNRGRKRGKSCIPTDTPIKNEIEQESWERERKKLGKGKKKILFSDDESDVENIPISSSDSLTSEDELPLNHFVKPKKNDFVVVQFVGKQLVKHYKLLTDIEDNEYDFIYLRRSGKVDNHFYFPIEPDMATKIPEQKLQAFSVGSMGTRALSRRELEEQRKKEEEEAAAHVFKEFVETFQEVPSSTSKVWVKAGTYDAGARKEDTSERGKLYKPISRLEEKRPTTEEVVRALASTPRSSDSPRTKHKYVKDKKKSNLELFKEELRQ